MVDFFVADTRRDRHELLGERVAQVENEAATRTAVAVELQDGNAQRRTGRLKKASTAIKKMVSNRVGAAKGSLALPDHKRQKNSALT